MPKLWEKATALKTAVNRVEPLKTSMAKNCGKGLPKTLDDPTEGTEVVSSSAAGFACSPSNHLAGCWLRGCGFSQLGSAQTCKPFGHSFPGPACEHPFRLNAQQILFPAPVWRAFPMSP